MRNNTDFQYTLSNAIEEDINRYKPGYFAIQQQLLIDYMTGKITKFVPRGILIFHEMGVGKTRAFVGIAAALRKPVIAIMAATLVENFRQTIQSYERAFHTSIEDKFHFFSLDAYNMYDKLSEYLSDGNSMSDHTIIIDEAHEFFSKVLNADNKNAPRVYLDIWKAKGVTILLGSGTPIWKDPAELVPCFNMIEGRAIFPENYAEFYDLFIDRKFRDVIEDNSDYENGNKLAKDVPKGSMGMINKSLLQNRLFGYISYIPRNPVLFPEKRQTIIEKIPLDINLQWSQYKLARLDEIEEVTKAAKFRRGPDRQAMGIGRAKNKSSTTYRQRSRAICNSIYDKKLGKIVSPKLDKLADNLEKCEGKGIVYSQFKEHGIHVLARLLIERGWTEIHPQERGIHLDGNETLEDDETKFGGDVENYEDQEGDEDVGYEIKEKTEEEAEEDAEKETEDAIKEQFISKISTDHRPVNDDLFTKTFSILDGDTPSDLRKQIIDDYNQPSNKFGRHIRVLLGTTILTRGISLRNGLHAHVIEPYWYYAQVLQFETRISRTLSHNDMPPNMRYTQTYIYLSTLPSDEWREKESTDESIYYRAITRQFILDEFLEAFKESAIECTHLAKIVPTAQITTKCRMCKPTNKPLFSDNIYEDKNKADPCQSIHHQKVTTKKITIGDREYRYSRESPDALTSIYKMAIYYKDTRLNAYVRLGENKPEFMEVYEAILKEL